MMKVYDFKDKSVVVQIIKTEYGEDIEIKLLEHGHVTFRSSYTGLDSHIIYQHYDRKQAVLFIHQVENIVPCKGII